MNAHLPSDPVHVVAGESAAGCLQAACRQGWLPGEVACIPADFTHGPLDPPDARDDYWAVATRGYFGDADLSTDHGSLWDAICQSCDTQTDLVVWGGANAGDMVLLNAVAARVADRDCALWRLDVSTWAGGPHYVAEFEPQRLAKAWPDALVAVSATERRHRAAEFNRLARSTGVLRRFEMGEVIGASPNTYDEWLLQACSREWTYASRVVGAAMGRCDSHNRMSDLFFSMRLQLLIDKGALEATGPRVDLRSYSVRLPG